MTSAIAFFPWVATDEPFTAGPLRLIPYQREHLPGDQPSVSQADIDGALSAYTNDRREPVQAATLLEAGDWKLGMDADTVVEDLFRSKELVAFSALSRRRFFSHFEYTNYDSYALTVQRFAPGGAKAFAFSTRRRDGQSTQFWSSSEFAFTKPLHVESNQKLLRDECLVRALLQPQYCKPFIYEAVREFNAANTDSNVVPPHTELVMMKSAWEALLQVSPRADRFERGLLEATGLSVLPFPDGPLTREWQTRWTGRARLLSCWAREFCALRGVAAHGATGDAPCVWSDKAHLLFSALLFPLVLKKILSDAGAFLLDAEDRWKILNIDKYLTHDPAVLTVRGERVHPWLELDSNAAWEAGWQ